MNEIAGLFGFAFIFFVFGYLVAKIEKKEKKCRMWYIEKEKNPNDWRFWDEDKSLLKILLVAIRLKKNGYKSRIKRYKFYTDGV